MSFDAHTNFAYSTVATAPSPATSGTTLTVQTGDGAKFPAAPFNATVWPAGVQPTSDVAEIVRVTSKGTGDNWTITRAQESSTAKSVTTGFQISATITAKTLTDVEKAAGTLNTVASSGASQTINYSTANTWDITLTADCTFTLSGATSGDPDTLTLILRQDGTGGRKVTWPGSVTWLSGAAPTLHSAISAIDVVTLFSDDGGTTWIGAQAAAPYPTGYEIGYSEITATVNITDTLETTATALITAGPYTFDGSPVICEFYSPGAICDSAAATDSIKFTLFEGATEIGRFGLVRTVATAATNAVPILARRRFTPSSGSHTYKLCAFATSTTGTPQMFAGPGGANYLPAYLRFTKV